MTNEQTRQLDPTTLAVLHDAGGRWSVLVADVSGPQPKIRATRQFDGDDGDSISGWLDTHQVGEVLAVVPASSVICRTCTLPDVEPEQLEQGLELQAEAHLNGVAPSYRTAQAVLPAAESESNRSGLVLAWPESSEIDIPEMNRPVFFTADIAALGAMLDVERPVEPIVWVDRHNDALAVAMTHANGAVLRATRERATSEADISRGVQRALAETALNVGHTDSYIESLNASTETQLAGLSSNGAALLLPSDLKSRLMDRVDGAGADQQWWTTYGIAVGALLARSGPLQPLTTMIDAPPTTAPSIIHQVVDRLSHPRTAALVTAAVVLILALSPIVFNGLRLGLLKLRYSSLDEKIDQVDRARNSLTMYKELQDEAWPMTKLLSDLANCTPLGIELEVIRLRQDQMLTVAGSAAPHSEMSAPELVSLMEQQLRDTGVFSEVYYNWGDPTANARYEFELNAKINRPYRMARYPVEQDFGRWTHEMRRNGDPPPGDDESVRTVSNTLSETDEDDTQAQPNNTPPRNTMANAGGGNDDSAAGQSLSLAGSNSLPGPGGDREESSSGRSRDNRTRMSSGGARDTRDDISGIDERGSAVDPGAPPEFLNEATIDTLSRQETIDRLSKVASAKKRWKNDEEVMAKLNEQWTLLMARLKEVPN